MVSPLKNASGGVAWHNELYNHQLRWQAVMAPDSSANQRLQRMESGLLRAAATSLGCLAALLVLSSLAAAQSDDDSRYNIMTPEPWLPPKYKSPRGSTEQVVVPPPARPLPPPAGVPRPLYVPQTGRALPNLPNVAPSGPLGQETYQDRAARCAHQAGIYGQAAGNTSTYINSCINQ